MAENSRIYAIQQHSSEPHLLKDEAGLDVIHYAACVFSLFQANMQGLAKLMCKGINEDSSSKTTLTCTTMVLLPTS